MKEKFTGYFLHIYMQNERPKTLDEWSAFLNMSKSSMHDRVKDGTLFKIMLSNDNIEMFSTVYKTK